MIEKKDRASIEKMATAGSHLAEIFELLAAQIAPGVTTSQIDALVDRELTKRGMRSETKGYMGYAHASCASVNDEVVHGVPSAHRVLKDGDVISVDVCASWNGYCADMARTFFVGSVANATKLFVATAQRALDEGIHHVRPGNKLSDVSAAIQRIVEKQGYSVVRDFAGHGIGRRMHEEPEILNYGKPGRGPVLQAGMTLAIEPMITMGGYEVHVTADGWTVKTDDGSLAAHVEDTVLVTEDEPRILTRGTGKAVSPGVKRT